jgi:Zinc carboxypeptidase
VKKRLILFAVVLCLGAARNVRAQIDFTHYHTPTSLASDLASLAATHPANSQLFSIGTSVEGRPIQGIKISTNPAIDDPAKGDVIFVGLHHAREWLAAEMPLRLAEYLLTTNDHSLQACMNNLQIWIIPVLNPDGYAYTAASATNRYWRKNRRDNGDGTFGVDLNRNYGFEWGLNTGSSPNTNDETYRGTSPFSESEVAAFRDFVAARHNPKALLTYHTFTEQFLRPWSYTTSDPPGKPTLEYIVQDSIARIDAVHGESYGESVGYLSSGEATDYFWNQYRMAAFTPEMRPAAGALDGFSPPESEIVPNNEENLPAALALIRDAGCRALWIKDYPADTGAEPSAVWSGGGWSQAFWVSPDIWTVPATLVGGSTVTLNVRVHNDGNGKQKGAIVSAYYTDPRISLEFPNPAAVLIGQQTVDLPPGDTTVSFSWTVPTGTNIWGEHHWCVGAIVMHPDDRPLTTEIQLSSNIGGHNFQTVDVLAGERILAVAITNYLGVAAEYHATINRERLPRGWEAVVPPLPPNPKPDRKALLLGVKGRVLEPGETVVQPILLRVPPSAKAGTKAVIQVNGVLKPLVPGKRVPMGNGYTFEVRVPKCKPAKSH